MFRFNRSIAATAFAFAAAQLAGAQAVAQSGGPAVMDCETNVTAPGAFTHCALTLKKTRLERGSTNAVVTRPACSGRSR